ncbi:protein HVA22-like isoform X1 [Panicum miliaceum]|uniref:HVA22-like protein n=1 Tax=Panicum miliaceum TaxID=4540 RepID=A0A3L6PPM5_PANMI|nr:protein HVA22-like isoform X1 [Panicum miliaceum]
MGKSWALITHLHTVAGPSITLLYPLYASVCAMESPTKVDDEQWLSYWIIYSFITLLEMVAEPVLYWIPIWYPVKLLFVAWLVLPQFKGASFIYEKLVRDQLRKYRARHLRMGAAAADDQKVHIAKTEHDHVQ